MRVEAALERAREPPCRARAARGAGGAPHIIGVSVSETSAEIAMAIAERDRELAEQAADDAAHEQDRDEHREQRDGDRDDGEADLLRALERRLAAAACPPRCRRAMFSVTTMASSTTKPVEIVSAISDRLSRL